MELEGLRGIAALIVVIYHNILAFYAIAFLGAGAAVFQHSKFEDNLYGNPVLGLFSGTFAVAIFFVLSGFVLSIAYFKKRNSEVITRLAIKRYPRLMLPALASTILCLILIKLGLSHTQAAASLTGSTWLQDGWNFIPGFWNALWSGTIDIFQSGSSSYNNALWTMKIEFLGSFLVFGFLLLFSNSKHRWIMYILLSILTLNTWLLGFVIGMILADLYSEGIIRKHKRNTLAVVGLIGLAVILGGYPYSGSQGGFYGIIENSSFIGVNYLIMSTIIGAAIIVFVALWSQQFTNVLSKKYVSILGKYTFSLYLVHLPILYTFTTGMFLLLSSRFGYNTSVILALLLSVPVITISTVLFEKYIDGPAIKFSSWLADLYYGTKKKKVFVYIQSLINRFHNSVVRK